MNEFNKHKICLNPEVVEIHRSDKNVSTLALALSPKGWCYGYSFNCHNASAGSGAGYGEYRTTYPTREAALMAGLEDAIRWATHTMKFPESADSARSFKKGAEQYRALISQLSLF